MGFRMKIALTVVMLSALSAASVAYNDWIDDNEIEGIGGTSMRVAFGVMYTLIVASAIASVWFGTRSALYLSLINVVSFIASGMAMIWGDAVRDAKTRWMLP